MAAHELDRNNATRHCFFAIDSEDDLKFLPTSKSSGKGMLSTSSPCRQGSIARTTSGTRYVLSGDDKWTYSSSGGGGGGGSEDIEPIATSTIEKLFE